MRNKVHDRLAAAVSRYFWYTLPPALRKEAVRMKHVRVHMNKTWIHIETMKEETLTTAFQTKSHLTGQEVKRPVMARDRNMNIFSRANRKGAF